MVGKGSSAKGREGGKNGKWGGGGRGQCVCVREKCASAMVCLCVVYGDMYTHKHTVYGDMYTHTYTRAHAYTYRNTHAQAHSRYTHTPHTHTAPQMVVAGTSLVWYLVYICACVTSVCQPVVLAGTKSL